MKYTTENTLKEIKRRAILIRQKRNKRITNYLAATASITLVVLFAVIRFLDTEVSEAQNAYGLIILSVKTEGYIPTAVLGFVLGTIVTVINNRQTIVNWSLT